MKYIYCGIQTLLVFSFLCHSYFIIAPALDEIGYFAVGLHSVLATISAMLYTLSQELKREEKIKDKPEHFIGKDDL